MVLRDVITSEARLLGELDHAQAPLVRIGRISACVVYPIEDADLEMISHRILPRAFRFPRNQSSEQRRFWMFLAPSLGRQESSEPGRGSAPNGDQIRRAVPERRSAPMVQDPTSTTTTPMTARADRPDMARPGTRVAPCPIREMASEQASYTRSSCSAFDQ